MNKVILLLLTLGVGAASQAANAATEGAKPAPERSIDVEDAAGRGDLGYERVDSIPALRRLHSFHALDRDSLIVWATPFDPYLVELRWPAHDLRFAWSIGVTQSIGRIHSKFDSVQVDGFRYPIDRIYKLTRDEARELTRSS